MATRNISIRLSLQDQETVKRGLEKLGAEGQAALKKIEAGSAPASRGLLALNDATRSLSGGMAALGLTAAATGLAMLAKRSIDGADAMNDLQLKTGLAFKQLAGFDLIARQSGTTLDGVASSVKFLQRYMIEHGDKLRAIGVTATDTNGAMEQFADIIAGIQDPALRSALAMEVLSRGGVDMIPVLMGGSAALREAMDAASGYGAALEKSAPMADEFNDMVAQSGSQLKEFREQVLIQLLPVMQDFLTYFNDSAASVDGLGGAAESVAGALKSTGAVLAYMALGAETAARSFILLGEALSLRLSGEWELANQANIEFGKAIGAASDRTDKFIEILNREAPAVRAVTNEVTSATKAYDAQTASRDAGIKKILEGGEAEKKAAAAAKKTEADKIAGLKEEAQLIFRISELVEKDLEDQAKKAALLPDYIRGLEEDLRLAGLTAEARAEELALIEASKRAVGGLTEADEAHIRAIVKATSAQEAGRKAAEEAAQQWTKIWDNAAENIQDSLAGAFRSALDGSLNSGKDFARAFKNLMLDTIAQVASAMVFRPVVNGVMSAVGLGGQTGGGAGGALGMAGNAASLGNFLSGGSSLLGLGGAQGGIARVLSTGSFSSVGPIAPGFASTIGAAAPYAAAAFAAFSVARSMGLIGPGRTVGSNAGGRVAERDGRFVVEGVGGDRNGGPDLLPQVTSTLQAAADAINEFTNALGTPQSGSGAGVAMQLYASGRNPINITAAELVSATISAGVIEGLTAAESAIITSARDVFDGMEQVLANRAFPKEIADILLQKTDPKAFAVKMLDAEIEGLRLRAQAATDNGVTLANIEKIYQLELADIQKQFAGSIADDWNAAGNAASNAMRAANDNFDALGFALNSIVNASQAAIEGLQNTADSLKAFLTGLDSGQLSFLNINQQYAAAKSAYAANANPETARTLLELSKQRDPGIGFARDSAQIRQQFGNTVSGTPGLIAAEQQRAARDMQAARDAPFVAIAQQVYAQLVQRGDQAAIDVLLRDLETGGGIVGGRPGLRDVVGFANGGVTPTDRPFIVGESGPEIMRMSVPGHVTSNRNSFDNSAVVTELQDVKARLERLDAALVAIAVKTSDTEARQRKWDATGLLTRTA